MPLKREWVMPFKSTNLQPPTPKAFAATARETSNSNNQASPASAALWSLELAVSLDVGFWSFSHAFNPTIAATNDEETPHYHIARTSSLLPSAKNFCKTADSKPGCPWAARLSTSPNHRRPGCPPRKSYGPGRSSAPPAAADC